MLVYKDPLLTYLLVSVPSILTLSYMAIVNLSGSGVPRDPGSPGRDPSTPPSTYPEKKIVNLLEGLGVDDVILRVNRLWVNRPI